MSRNREEEAERNDDKWFIALHGQPRSKEEWPHKAPYRAALTNRMLTGQNHRQVFVILPTTGKAFRRLMLNDYLMIQINV